MRGTKSASARRVVEVIGLLFEHVQQQGDPDLSFVHLHTEELLQATADALSVERSHRLVDDGPA